jgi:hypothetical protein
MVLGRNLVRFCSTQQMTEVIAQQNAALISLQAERDTAWSERDAAQVEIEKLLPWAWKAERLAAAVHA